MTEMYKTGNDTPSGAPKDFHDNSMTIDAYVNEKSSFIKTRLGDSLISLFGINKISQEKIAEFDAEVDRIIKEAGGIEVVGDFGESIDKVINQEKITKSFIDLEKNFMPYAPVKPSGVCCIRKTSGGAIVWSQTEKGAVSIRVVRGNQATPSLPSNSENGFWEFYRTTEVVDILVGYMYKAPEAPDGVSFSWVSFEYLGILPDSFGEYARMGYLPLRPDNIDKFIQVVRPNQRNEITISFLCTPGSPDQFIVNIGGNKVEINLTSPFPVLKTFSFLSGKNPQQITFEAPKNGTFNLIGFNLFDVKNKSSIPAEDLDSWAYYLNVDPYIYSRGASDYALQSAKNRLWAGSYHGGERAISIARFILDSGAYSHETLPDFHITDSFSIIQNTEIKWGTGESVRTATNTSIGNGVIQIDGGFYDCDISVMTAVVGMSTTSDSFTLAQASKIIDTTEQGTYDFGNINYITQINPKNGMSCDSLFSAPPILQTNRGLVVSQTPKAYAKVYPPFINGMRTAPVKLPDSFSFFNRKKFY